MTESADLSDDLKSVIDRYLDGHRTRSLATLSRVSGVAYTTLRRFSQREGNPTAEPVLKIVDATLPTKDKIEFLGKHFPELARFVHFDQKTYSQDESGRTDFKFFFMRDPHNYLLNLAISDHGTSAEDIQRLCGERGMDALDELVEHEILTREPRTGKVRYKDHTIFSVDVDMGLAQVKRSADYFDRSLIGSKAAKFCHATAAVNKDGLEKIHAVVTDAIARIFALKDDPRHTGDIPFFVDVLMNVLDKKPLTLSQEDPRHV